MEILWPTLAVLLVLTSIAGILGTKRSALSQHVFYILLFLFFALAVLTLLRISLVLAVGVLPALMLFTLILLKGKNLQTTKRGENLQREQGFEDTQENR
ncbi:MAG: hypothetical protein ACP5DY_00510 [Thermovirgaceae bacterium]